MITDPFFYLAAVAGVLLAGISKAGFGGAAGGLAVPLMALSIAAPQAAAIMLPILLVIDAVGLVVFRGKFDGAHLRIILPGALAGIAIGAMAFRYVDPRWIKGLIGIEAVLFALDRLRVAARPERPRPPEVASGLFWSCVSGFTSFISHAGGPPIMQYLLPRGLDRVLMVGTTVIYFSVVNFAKLVPYAWLGLLDLGNLLTSALLLPVIPVGYRIGLRLLHGLDQRRFNLTVAWLLLATGLKLLWDVFGP